MNRIAALALAIALPFSGAAAAEDTARSSVDGVTVAVTPLELGATASAWRFKIVLDTHSQDLSDDLATSARLLDTQGRETGPDSWDGAPPGGHHREGVLTFRPLRPAPDEVELRIARPGEPAPRSFRFPVR